MQRVNGATPTMRQLLPSTRCVRMLLACLSVVAVLSPTMRDGYVDAAPIASVSLKRRESLRSIALRFNMTLPEPQFNFQMHLNGQDHRMRLHDFQNVSYFAELSVGTPPKVFEMIYDTGSSDVWVPQKGCPSCGSHAAYDSASSSTSVPDGSVFQVQYGSGPVSGTNVFDVVAFGNITVPHYNFAQISDASGLSGYDNSPFDGIVGLAYPAIASSPHVPLFYQAMQEHLVEEPVFCFYLGKKDSADGAIDFGGIDRTKYKGELRYAPVVQQQWWVVGLDSMTVGGQSVSSTSQAIVDSGTSLLVGPEGDVANLVQALGAQYVDVQGEQFVVIECSKVSTLKDIAITVGGVPLVIPGPSLFLQQFSSTTCMLGIEESPNPFWILGDVFMRSYYTVFDYGKNRIGFAEAV